MIMIIMIIKGRRLAGSAALQGALYSSLLHYTILYYIII